MGSDGWMGGLQEKNESVVFTSVRKTFLSVVKLTCRRASSHLKLWLFDHFFHLTGTNQMVAVGG